MNMKIREATVDDVEHLQELFASLQGYYGADVVVADVGKKSILNALQKIGEGFVLIAFNSEAVGFASIVPLFLASNLKTAWFVKDLYILPSERGSRIGEKLMRAAAREVIKRGGTRLDLTTDEGNSGAKRFYNGLAARRISKIYYRYDESELEKLAHR